MSEPALAPMHYATLTQACRRIKSGEWSSAAVTAQLLSRIAEQDVELHSFARLRAEQALERARWLDEQQAAGEPLGLLHGVPIAIKDLLFIASEVAASGTIVMQDYRPSYSATVVQRLEQAGAVIIGQTQMTEGAFGLHHPDLMAPLNPWHPGYWSGVSSSGSGVAVASGLAYGALGTDTGGSIRFPCACCGLVGIKPTYGLVSRYGAWPLAPSMDHIGPMTRSVADAARMLQVIAGADDNDVTTLTAPIPNYTALSPGRLEGVRVGIDWSYCSTGVAAEVVEVVTETSRLLVGLGASLERVELPAEAALLTAGWSETCGVEAARAHADYYPQRETEYGPALRSLIEIGLRTSADRYKELEELRATFTRDLNQLLETVDLLLLPAIPTGVPTIATAEGAATNQSEMADFLTFTAPFDYSGHPTLSLPAGLETRSSDGRSRLPRAVQLVGAKQGEAGLIQAGLALEAALNSHYGEVFSPGGYPR